MTNNINSQFFYLKDSYFITYNGSSGRYEKRLIKPERLISIDTVDRIAEYVKDDFDTFCLFFKDDRRNTPDALYVDKVSKDETLLEFFKRIQMPILPVKRKKEKRD